MPHLLRHRLPSILLGLGLVVAGLAFHYRLALTPDRVVSARVFKSLTGARGLDAVRARLSERYRVISQGNGDGGWFTDGRSTPVPNAKCIHFVVGHYSLPFTTSVEGLVVLDASGQARQVLIRRNTDAL